MAPTKRPPIERFLEKIRHLDNGCQEWTAYRGGNGYGRFYYGGKGALAHRWSYEFHVGPIPDGLVIDHRCRNRGCVNPDHLEAVTMSENVLRGIGPETTAARRRAISRCPQGHPYTDENTYVDGQGGRACRICKRSHARASYERDRARVIERAREWRQSNPERAREQAREASRRWRSKKKAVAS